MSGPQQILRPWDSQSQDLAEPTTEPIARGLAFLWSASQGRRELVTNELATTVNAVIKPGSLGTVADCATGQTNIEWVSQQFITTSNGSGTGDFSMLVVANPAASGTVGHVYAQKNDAGGGAFSQTAMMAHSNNAGITSSGAFAFLTYSTANTGLSVASMCDGNWHTYLGVRRGTVLELYRDGVLAGSASGTARAITQTPARYTAIGSRGNGTTESFPDDVMLAAGWNRALSFAEAEEITRRPQQLFSDRRILVEVSAAGGGASTADLATTGSSGTFAGSANSTTTATVAATGGSGTFAGTASSPAVAALAVAGGSGAFAGTAQSVSSAAAAISGGSGVFAGSANSTTTAALAVTGNSGVFAGSASTGASATLAATGDSGVFAGSASSPATAALATTGGSGAFSGVASSPAVAALVITGNSGVFSGLASTVGTATVAVTGNSGSFSGSAFSLGSAFLAALGDSGIFAGSASVAAPSAIGRPTSDTSNAGWTASTGSDLYAMLDEVTPNPADYIVATSVGAVCELALNSTSYPGTASQVLKFRASSSTGNSVIVRLKNTGGATVRTATQALTASDTEYSITLTAGEIAAITSGALSVQLESA